MHKTVRSREAALNARLGKLLCNFDMGEDAPAPDPLIGQAASKNAAIADKALSWYQKVYDDAGPARDSASVLANEQAGLQNELSKEQLRASQDERSRYVETFQPIESRIAADAAGYDTPGRRAAEAGQATADVQSQFDVARGNLGRELAARGVDTGSGAGAIALSRMSTQQALAGAAAENQARRNVETVGSAKMADAAALGRGTMTNQATTAQLGINAGNSSVGSAQAPLMIATQGAQLAGQGFNTALQANQSAGQLLVGQANAQAQAAGANNGAMGGIGSAVGAIGAAALPYLVAASDKNLKEDVTSTTDEEALDAVTATPVKNWKYKPGTAPDDGGVEHTGPMAQDVQKTMGSKVAPGGKMIDLISANGVTMKAIQALDKKVGKIAAKVGVSV